jgi:hypothetical protein
MTRQVRSKDPFSLDVGKHHEQIVTTNHRNPRRPITKEKLAYDVAKCITAHLKELEVSGQRNPDVSRADSVLRRMGPPFLPVSRTCSSQGFITSHEHPGSPRSGTEFPRLYDSVGSEGVLRTETTACR